MNREKINDQPANQPGRLERLRAWVPFVPGSRGALPERTAYNGILRRFQSRFGVIPVQMSEMPSESEESTARERIGDAAGRLVAGGIIDDETLVEVRPLMPEAALDHGLARNSLSAVSALNDTLRDDYGINAIPNSHPLMPVKQIKDDEPVDTEQVWQLLGDELELFRRQARFERNARGAAMIALAEPSHARGIFNEQLVFDGQPLEEGQPMVLSRVAPEANGHVLAPVPIPVNTPVNVPVRPPARR